MTKPYFSEPLEEEISFLPFFKDSNNEGNLFPQALKKHYICNSKQH
jgi:hypothetical protein